MPKRPELTKRERSILDDLGQGKEIVDIARWMGISKKTVDWHIQNIYDKLEVNCRAQAVVKGTRMGFIKPLTEWPHQWD